MVDTKARARKQVGGKTASKGTAIAGGSGGSGRWRPRGRGRGSREVEEDPKGSSLNYSPSPPEDGKGEGVGGEGADPRLVEIAKAYASEPGVSMGKLFASVGLRVRGKIFAMVVRDRLVVKLPKARVDELVARGMAERFDPGHGRLMKEWAVFGGKKPTWASLAREAFEYVGSL